MLREELHDYEDSGWQFFAGDEDDEYINNVEHVELCRVYSIAVIFARFVGIKMVLLYCLLRVTMPLS